MNLHCKKSWKGEFGDDLHFSHSSSNSCRVLITFYGNQDIAIKKRCPIINNSCFRCIDYDCSFLLINNSSSNTKKEQVSVPNELTTILSNFENINNQNVMFAGDFDVFFEALLDAKGDTPNWKSWPNNKMIETLDLFLMYRE